MKRTVTIAVLVLVATLVTGCSSRGGVFTWGQEQSAPVYYASPAATEVCR